MPCGFISTWVTVNQVKVQAPTILQHLCCNSIKKKFQDLPPGALQHLMVRKGTASNGEENSGSQVDQILQATITKSHQQRWPGPGEMYSCMILETRSLKSSCWLYHRLPWKLLEASFFWPLPAQGGDRKSWCSLACGSIALISASIFTWLAFLCVL